MTDKNEQSGCRDFIPMGIILSIFLILGLIADFDKGLAIDILKAILIAIGAFLAVKFILLIIGKDLKDTFQNIKMLLMFLIGFIVLVFIFGSLSKCSGDTGSLPTTEIFYRK